MLEQQQQVGNLVRLPRRGKPRLRLARLLVGHEATGNYPHVVTHLLSFSRRSPMSETALPHGDRNLANIAC